jgi:SET domain-containing protein
MIALSKFQGMGRGVIAHQDIKAGALVMACPTLILSKRDTELIQKTELKFYTYSMNTNRDLIALGPASLLNHSDEPNLKYELAFEDDECYIKFYSLRDINSGEQLLIDYKADYPVDINDYIRK